MNVIKSVILCLYGHDAFTFVNTSDAAGAIEEKSYCRHPVIVLR